ncbi:MAG TPA: sigma-70 family RNA polymerase sigma factor [Tepidisphaeraceae bacterium]|jgi:RNA polymerase sigma factor (sigma-70 family)
MQDQAIHDTTAGDSKLLAQFARTGCDRSFAELVDRYVNLVYSAALRQLGRHDLAEDVTQRVWMVLARKAPAIPQGKVLGAWLIMTTRNLSMDLRKTEMRRRERERKAAEMTRMAGTTQAEAAVRERLAGLIDDAIASLSRANRDAIALRFLEGRSTGEVAGRLGVSADAARQRISRAIGSLRAYLRRRGVDASSATLLALFAPDGAAHAPHALTSWLASFSHVAGHLRVKGAGKVAVKLWETARAEPWQTGVVAGGLGLVVAALLLLVPWVHHHVVWDPVFINR